jgi:hypothetical protein
LSLWEFGLFAHLALILKRKIVPSSLNFDIWVQVQQLQQHLQKCGYDTLGNLG